MDEIVKNESSTMPEMSSVREQNMLSENGGKHFKKKKKLDLTKLYNLFSIPIEWIDRQIEDLEQNIKF